MIPLDIPSPLFPKRAPRPSPADVDHEAEKRHAQRRRGIALNPTTETKATR